MNDHLVKQFFGCWKSDTKTFEKITFRVESYSVNEDKGKWSVQGDQIWLIDKDLKNGIKWFFEFEDENNLVFSNPEDFVYQGRGEYIYYQMTSPKIKIEFYRHIG